MLFDSHDIVSDILQRVARAAKIGNKALTEIDAQIRTDWGGCRCYVAKSGEDARARLAERDRQIRKEFRYGEHVALLARRWEVTERHIRRIIANDSGHDLP